jgi:hypothetical protein
MVVGHYAVISEAESSRVAHSRVAHSIAIPKQLAAKPIAWIRTRKTCKPLTPIVRPSHFKEQDPSLGSTGIKEIINYVHAFILMGQEVGINGDQRGDQSWLRF